MKITLRLIVALYNRRNRRCRNIFLFYRSIGKGEAYFRSGGHRAWLVSEGVKESAGPLIRKGPSEKLDSIAEKDQQGKQIIGVAVYDAAGKTVAVSKELSAALPSKLNILFEEFKDDEGMGAYEEVASKQAYLYAVPAYDEEGARTGTVVIFSDASYIDDYLRGIWRQNFLRIFANAVIISRS